MMTSLERLEVACSLEETLIRCRHLKCASGFLSGDAMQWIDAALGSEGLDFSLSAADLLIAVQSLIPRLVADVDSDLGNFLVSAR